MEINIGILGEDNQEPLQSVYKWLIDDTDVRTSARIKLTDSSPEPGSMAGEIELISLLVSSGFNIASLAVAIAGWRSSRTAPPAVRVEVSGNIVTIGESDVEAEVIEKIRGALPDGFEDIET